jgi:hypothetical protein
MNTDIINQYLRGLQEGDYNKIISLFTKNAVINSPLYGKIKATKFYKELFKDTNKSKIKLINIFENKNKDAIAAYFIYDWKITNNSKTKFNCIDIFKLTKDRKIKELTIVYDTAEIRSSWNKLK